MFYTVTQNVLRFYTERFTLLHGVFYAFTQRVLRFYAVLLFILHHINYWNKCNYAEKLILYT
jgi:hypothetical protein